MLQFVISSLFGLSPSGQCKQVQQELKTERKYTKLVTNFGYPLGSGTMDACMFFTLTVFSQFSTSIYVTDYQGK